MKIGLIYLLVFLILEGCASNKKLVVHRGGRDEAIQNAISDFLSTKSMRKSDSVFSVSFYDTLYKMILERVDSRNSQWILGEPYKNIIAVRIGRASRIGSKDKLPSRVIKKNGKLFYWWDDNYTLTAETISVLKQYHIPKNDIDSAIAERDISIDERTKAAHYYFCRYDLSNYKRIITWKGIGYYDAPTLTCGE